jgi:phenylethanolamine N-methyltransferase
MSMDLRKLVFDTWANWSSRSYLQTYYSHPMADTKAVIDFLEESLRNGEKRKFNEAIDFGAGPTIFGALVVEPYINHLDIAEYLPQNIREIKKWIANEPGAFDWTYWAQYILGREGDLHGNEHAGVKFSKVRSKIRNIFKGDATINWPTSGEEGKRYDLLVSLFCAESITDSKEEWKRNLHNILKLAAPGGTILISALRNCSGYKVGKSNFPATPINEIDLKDAIQESSLDVQGVEIQVKEVPDCKEAGFDSILLARILVK